MEPPLDGLQFFASIVDSLAWPATIGVAVYLLRKPLVELLPNLRHLKYKDLDIRFGEGLEKLEQEVEPRPSPEQIPPRSDLQTIADERFELLAEISPGAAVLEAWTDIERKLRILAQRHDIQEPSRSITRITRALVKREIISSRLASVLDHLRFLRNSAAHPTDEWQISLPAARRYKGIVDQVGDELQLLLE